MAYLTASSSSLITKMPPLEYLAHWSATFCSPKCLIFFTKPYTLYRQSWSSHLAFVAHCLEKSRSFEDSSNFWDLQRKTVFPLLFEAFGKVAAFWGQNKSTHEIHSLERANLSLSNGAKQRSLRLLVFELWFFESFFIFYIFPKNKELS